MKNLLMNIIRTFCFNNNIECNWIFNPDSDHIYFYKSKKWLHDSIKSINTGIIKNRQYIVYPNNKILYIPHKSKPNEVVKFLHNEGI